MFVFSESSPEKETLVILHGCLSRMIDWFCFKNVSVLTKIWCSFSLSSSILLLCLKKKKNKTKDKAKQKNKPNIILKTKKIYKTNNYEIQNTRFCCLCLLELWKNSPWEIKCSSVYSIIKFCCAGCLHVLTFHSYYQYCVYGCSAFLAW